MNELCKKYLSQAKIYVKNVEIELTKEYELTKKQIKTIENWYKITSDILYDDKNSKEYKGAKRQARQLFYEGIRELMGFSFAKINEYHMFDTYMMYKEIIEMIEETEEGNICDMYSDTFPVSPETEVTNYILVFVDNYNTVKAAADVYEIDEYNNTIMKVKDETILDKVKMKYNL